MFSLAVLSFALGYLTILLVGSHECFHGTIVERWHYALTDGVCNAFDDLVEKFCGRRGVACLNATEKACCGGSNPIGQIVFAILFGGCFLVVVHEVFPRLPVDGFPGWHVYTGTFTASLCIALFSLVSFGDPGIISQAELDAHCALYPPDGVLFQERFCTTCKIIRPARAKHCNATKRCVARFDHWCIWINAPVGLYNTGWFLAFLVATSLTCFYGAFAATAVIRGEMQRRNAWDMVWIESSTRTRTRLGDSWRLTMQFLTAHYGAIAGAAVFMAFAGLIVAGFTCLQLYRIIIGVTTNESWKWKDMSASQAGGSSSIATKHVNAYNRGWRRNLAEVLWPRYYLIQALKALKDQ